MATINAFVARQHVTLAILAECIGLRGKVTSFAGLRGE